MDGGNERERGTLEEKLDFLTFRTGRNFLYTFLHLSWKKNKKNRKLCPVLLQES